MCERGWPVLEVHFTMILMGGDHIPCNDLRHVTLFGSMCPTLKQYSAGFFKVGYRHPVYVEHGLLAVFFTCGNMHACGASFPCTIRVLSATCHALRTVA